MGFQDISSAFEKGVTDFGDDNVHRGCFLEIVKFSRRWTRGQRFNGLTAPFTSIMLLCRRSFPGGTVSEFRERFLHDYGSEVVEETLTWTAPKCSDCT
jgi:hypothetical protein